MNATAQANSDPCRRLRQAGGRYRLSLTRPAARACWMLMTGLPCTRDGWPSSIRPCSRLGEPISRVGARLELALRLADGPGVVLWMPGADRTAVVAVARGRGEIVHAAADH